MTSTIRASASDILNQVGVEVGLDPVNDPFSSQDKSYRQMTYLINTAGEELAQVYPWTDMIKNHQIVTADTDSGDYDLPDDYLYMINQTGWERAENVPLYGPLSPQDWAYLEGRDLVSHTIYASFRLNEGKFRIFPQPPPNGLEINFEYMSRNWAIEAGTTDTLVDKVINGGDIPLYNRTLLGRYLKVKFLEAKGFDTTKAQADLNQMYDMLTSHDKAAPILSASRNTRGFPYLNSWNSVPDTGFGVP